MLKTAALTASLITAALLVAQPPSHEKTHGAGMEKCSKACADCMRACETCHHHCLMMLAEGKKEHQASAMLTADCADICAAAARSTARMGPLSKEICEACAKACDKCGAECEKHPNMPEMKQCAAACKACAAACREMTGGHAHHNDK